MRILLTGATGFLGSYLLKAFLKEGHQVIILKRSFSNLTRISPLLKEVEVYDIDQCALECPFMDYGKFDAVVHTATSYGRKGEDLVSVSKTNTEFPLAILEKAVEFGTGIFINTDTILPKTINAYAMSKKQFAEWGKFLADAGKIRFVNLQLEHMYGPKDDDLKFTTYVVKNCLNNVPELKLTAGTQQRDFIYIDDVVAAYLLLLKVDSYNNELYQNYELGSGKAISIRNFVEMVHRISNSSTILNFGAVHYREGEVMETHANIKALKKLGWTPKIDLEDGIKICIQEEVSK